MTGTGGRSICKVMRFAPFGGSVLRTIAQLFGCLPLPNRKLNAYLHIHLMYKDSCYFCKVTLSNNDHLELSESFAHNHKLRIHSALYNVMRSFPLTVSDVRSSSFAIFYLQTKFELSILIYPVYCRLIVDYFLSSKQISIMLN